MSESPHRIPRARQSGFRHVFVIYHRAGMYIAPENTLSAIRPAIDDAGVDAIEVDVRATSDGTAFLMHDASLLRTTGDPRPVAGVTADDVCRLRVADPTGALRPQPVPTLAETLAEVRARCVLDLDVKQEGISRAVAADIRRAGAEHWTWIWTESFEEGASYREQLPDVATGVGLTRATIARRGLVALLDRARREGLVGVSFEHTVLDQRVVQQAQQRGLWVKAWTVDDPADIERVRRAAVDAICTNYPGRVRAVVERLAA